MATGILACQFESTVTMPELPTEECALALAKFDAVLKKLKSYKEEGRPDDWKTCYGFAMANPDLPPSDQSDFEMLHRVFETANGAKFATWREQALQEGESCAEIADTGYKPDDSELVNRHVGVSTNHGFVLPLICNLLLHQVGLTPSELRQTRYSGEDSKIPRFFNRVLGWRLSSQEVVANLFYETLRAVIKEAKQKGLFDLGIKNLSGREIQFQGPPRCFRFRGLDAPDEAVLLYEVRVDSGIPVEIAKGLYDDAMKQDNVHGGGNDGAGDDAWLSTGRRAQIKTGFYTDNRNFLKKTPKVFLVINQSNVSLDKSLMVVRPNLGRRFYSVTEVFNSISRKEWKPCRTQAEIDRALKIWTKEFDLADIPRSDYYQQSCPGRHSTMMILSVSLSMPWIYTCYMFPASNNFYFLEGPYPTVP